MQQEFNGKKAGYLGPDGSYSQIAANAMCKGAQLVAYPSFYRVVKSLSSGEVDYAVLPIENTLNGGVLQNIDYLQNYAEFCAVREHTVRIDHRLFTLKGADKSKITRIYSHKQAIDQCSTFLTENYPDAQIIPTDSTSGGIDCIKSGTDAAIAGVQCKSGGLDMSEECISDEKNNYTHFLLVTKGKIAEGTPSQKIYFSLTCPHVPGGLLKLLQIIYSHNLNMAKIESRPIKDRVGEYRFFIELEADYSSKEVQIALKELQNATNSFRLLGCY